MMQQKQKQQRNPQRNVCESNIDSTTTTDEDIEYGNPTSDISLECFQNVEQENTPMEVPAAQLKSTAPKETRFELPKITDKSKGKYFAVYYTEPCVTYY